MPFRRDLAKQAGYTDAEIDSYLTGKKEQAKGGSFLKSAVEKLPQAMGGLGIVAGLPLGLSPLGGFGMYGAGYVLRDLLGPYVGYKPTSVSEGGIGNQLTGMAGAGIMGEALSMLPWLTKGGVAGKTTKAAEKATKEGTRIPWQETETGVREEVGKKLGATPEVKKTLEQLLAEKLPIASGQEMTLTPMQQLDWRRQIARRGGGNFFQRLLTGTSVPEKVEGVARSQISGQLHGYVPGTRLPDWLYSKYSGPLGSPVQAIPKLAIGGGIYAQLRSLLGRMGGGGGGGSSYYGGD